MKDVVKKWWFWIVGIVISSLVIFILISVFINKSRNEIDTIVLGIQEIDEEAITYISTKKDTIVIEVPNSSKDKIESMEKLIKSCTKDILKNYSKLIIVAHLEIDNEAFLINNVYTLPDVKQDVESESIYIDYAKYMN